MLILFNITIYEMTTQTYKPATPETLAALYTNMGNHFVLLYPKLQNAVAVIKALQQRQNKTEEETFALDL